MQVQNKSENASKQKGKTQSKAKKKETFLSVEQAEKLQKMFQVAGFGVQKSKQMVHKIGCVVSKTAQDIVVRILENQDVCAMRDWKHRFKAEFGSSFKMSRDDFKEALGSNPYLFFSSPETLYNHVCELQNIFQRKGIDVDKSDIVTKSSLKNGVLARSPETIAIHTQELIDEIEKRGVDVKHANFIRNIFKGAAQILLENGSTIGEKMDTVVDLLQKGGYPIEQEQYVSAVSKSVTLLYRDAQVMCQHFAILYGLYENGLCRVSAEHKKELETPTAMIRKILNDPARMGLGEDNLASRWQLACQLKEKDAQPSYYQLLHLKREDVAPLLKGYKCPLDRAIDKMRQRD